MVKCTKEEEEMNEPPSSVVDLPMEYKLGTTEIVDEGSESRIAAKTSELRLAAKGWKAQHDSKREHYEQYWSRVNQNLSRKYKTELDILDVLARRREQTKKLVAEAQETISADVDHDLGRPQKTFEDGYNTDDDPDFQLFAWEYPEEDEPDDNDRSNSKEESGHEDEKMKETKQ